MLRKFSMAPLLSELLVGALLFLDMPHSIMAAHANNGIEGDDSSSNNSKNSEHLTFGMVSGDSSFFEPVQAGWESECAKHNVTCHYLPVNYTYYFEHQADDYPHPCVPLMLDLIEMGVDGISAACHFEDVTPWQKAHDAGIPLVAFDTKPPEGFPIPLEAYVGTDQNFLGRTMARLLKQLKPEGGNFGIVYTPAFDDRVEAFRDEIFKDNDREDRPHWYEMDLPIKSYDLKNDIDQFPTFLDLLAEENPTAILFMYQTPMRAENYTEFIDKHRHRKILYIGTDGSSYQLEYLARRFVDGLVGQLPYDMGAFSVEILHQAVLERQNQQQQQRKEHATNEIVLDIPELKLVPTNLVAYNLIPIELPPHEVDQSLLGSLVIAGYTCFGIIALLCVLCVAWTVKNRLKVVVKASQPVFLLMIAIGVLLLASSLIPLSFDDHGNPELLTPSFAVGICMSIPWLAFTGFTCTFSALFSKTWRVNKFFHSKSSFGRLKVSEFDVLAPFFVLLTLNFIILICWTVIDPLTYERNFGLGTDYWNREIGSVGRCQSESPAAYLIPLACLNFVSLAIAAWQAWEARDIESEFSEGKYIGLCIFSNCQAFVTGFPIVALVKDVPEAFYLITVFLIFMLCLMVLLLMFLPKIIIQYKYSKLTLVEQRRMLAMSVRKSTFSSSSSPSRFASSEFSSQGLEIKRGQSANGAFDALQIAGSGKMKASAYGDFKPGRRFSPLQFSASIPPSSDASTSTGIMCTDVGKKVSEKDCSVEATGTGPIPEEDETNPSSNGSREIIIVPEQRGNAESVVQDNSLAEEHPGQEEDVD